MRFLVSFAVLFGMVAAVEAHLEDRIFAIYELPTADLPDLFDGSLEDWEEVVPDASLNQDDFGATTDSWDEVDPSNLAWRVFLAWNDATQRIYVAVERLDDVFLDDRDYENVSFMIDGDHSGGRYMMFAEESADISEAEARRSDFAQAQAYGTGLRQTNGFYMRTSSYRPWASQPPWTESYGSSLSDVPHDYLLEFAVTPWDDLAPEGPESSRRTVLEANGIVGFQIFMSDADEAGVPNGQYLIYPGTTEWPRHYFTQSFVDGLLIPCDTGDCSQRRGTSVRLDS